MIVPGAATILSISHFHLCSCAVNIRFKFIIAYMHFKKHINLDNNKLNPFVITNIEIYPFFLTNKKNGSFAFCFFKVLGDED